MKKGLLVTLAVCALFTLVGCGTETKEKENEYEKAMKEYATEYYNLRLKGTEGLTTTNVTIQQLKKDVEVAGGTYDMSKLSACKDTSYVELQINQTDNNISNYVFHMECE